MDSPDVSFIIPALNEELLIEKCLKSLRAQKTKLKSEIIVADGKSSDLTREISRRYAKVVVCKRKGIANARNFGARFARGKVLVFVDADTTLERGYLQKIWNYFREHKKVVAVTGNLGYDFSRPFLKFLWVAGVVFMRLGSFFGNGRLTGSNLAIRRDAFRRVGGFPDVPSEDVAITSALRKFGQTKYFPSAKAFTSPRRFDRDSKGILMYYLSRDILTFAKTHSRIFSPRFSRKFLKKTKYREIR